MPASSAPTSAATPISSDSITSTHPPAAQSLLALIPVPPPSIDMSASNTLMIEKFELEDVTPEMLESAAALFSSAYGVWGALAAEKMSKYCKPGQRVKMSVTRLREQLLATDTRNVFVRALSNNELAGHAFATRWDYQGRQVCWVTQLCVHPAFRSQKLATKVRIIPTARSALLSDLSRFFLNYEMVRTNDAFGILSSHPHSIMAALRAFGRGIEGINLDMTRLHAQGIIDASPIDYVKGAKLTGTLFGTGNGSEDSTCCADTSFWVDHTEMLAALQQAKDKGVQWPFGELPEGHEYIVLVENVDVGQYYH